MRPDKSKSNDVTSRHDIEGKKLLPCQTQAGIGQLLGDAKTLYVLRRQLASKIENEKRGKGKGKGREREREREREKRKIEEEKEEEEEEKKKQSNSGAVWRVCGIC